MDKGLMRIDSIWNIHPMFSLSPLAIENMT